MKKCSNFPRASRVGPRKLPLCSVAATSCYQMLADFSLFFTYWWHLVEFTRGAPAEMAFSALFSVVNALGEKKMQFVCLIR